MKLIKKDMERDSSGTVVLVPEEDEDLWYAYNLIAEGDELQTVTYRRIVKTDKDGQTIGKAVRKKYYLKVTVENVEFEVAESQLRVKGRVVDDVEDISAGTYHTLVMQLNTSFTLWKPEWDSMYLSTVDEACDVAFHAEVGAVIMQEGLAHVCLLTNTRTVVKQKVEQSIPHKKRGDNTAYEKGLKKFYEAVYQAIERNLDLERLKAVLLASPGFVAKDCFEYIKQRSVDLNNKVLVKNKTKFVLCHSSSGHLHSLEEVLKSPGVSKQLADTRYVKEVQILDKFFEMLAYDENRAWYGPTHVAIAVEKGAVSALLITDTLFRSHDIRTRKKYIQMVDQVKESGRDVYIFSSLHESGQQLDELSGIAAILLFPLDEEEIIMGEE